MDLLDDLESLGSEEEQEEIQMDMDSLQGLTRHADSQLLKSTLEQISNYQLMNREITSRLEEDEEYQTIVNANSLSFELQYELGLVKEYVSQRFARRFPELVSLIQTGREYMMAVKTIGNEENVSRLDLSFLQPATVMVINVTATTTSGRLLSGEELSEIMQGCDKYLEMDDSKQQLLAYVESRMTLLAPNLTKILQSNVAAKLIAIAGGLTNLAKIPSCNVLVLGANKLSTLGLSTVWLGKNRGVIYQCELIANAPSDVQRKVARVVSGRATLAARVDAARESPDGAIGQMYLQDIQRKIDLLVQPPPQKQTKALPVPDEIKKKRRGGRRARKMKERMGITELSKAQNRMAFGEQEEEVGFGDETIGLGMVGSGSGKIRQFQETKIKMPIKKQKTFHTNNPIAASGLASSVAFTPVKGIELENPDLVKKEEPKAKYFGAGFFRPPLPKQS
ncbi:hypothetical protein EDD86DRAFT_209337 [Gorgonomyces haynaldii]|nr:hypothetical protein EDD86DRAFT_209337 [Gorgonomyces haynaldii]